MEAHGVLREVQTKSSYGNSIGRDNIVETPKGWAVLRSNARAGNFPHPPRAALGPTQLPIHWKLPFFSGG